MKVTVKPQAELAAKIAVDLTRARRPSFGRTLDEFREGDVYVHPRGLTIGMGLAQSFAGTFHEANPLYLNREFAKGMGHPEAPVPPQLVFNVVLSLGVQNDSEKAIANLGYYDAFFPRAVYAGDTLRALTKVVGKKERGEGKPGIVSIRTVGLNQRDEVVLQYDRKILVAGSGTGTGPGASAAIDLSKQPTLAIGFPQAEPGVIDVPAPVKPSRNLTGARTWFEDFKPGDILVHANGRTVTDEHVAWTYRVGNTHPLHFDRMYSAAQSGPMSGEPIVYGGLVFAWLHGLASRDTTENALAEIGFTEGYHTQPTVKGDTLYAISRVLAAEPVTKVGGSNLAATAVSEAALDGGIVTFQLIGVKNVRGAEALSKHGAGLFQKELEKKEKISEKVFEIERRVLLRSRG